MLTSHHLPKTTNPIRRILTTTFTPLPTVKSIQTKKEPVQRIIYEAAHHLFRDYPLNKPLLIYQFQREDTVYDVFIERIEEGWKDYVHTHDPKPQQKKIVYMIDGLRQAIKEEKEIQPLLPHMAKQLDIMCRLLQL